MWTPPERIKHALPDGGWPTEEEAARSPLFQPLESLGMRQRTWIPAMVPWRASEDGFVTPDVIAWYARFAQGRPGALVVEATGVRDIPSGPLLRIGHDRFVPGLRELAAAVREASAGETRLFIQLIDFLSIRRRPEPEKYFARFLKLTDRHRAFFPGASDDELRHLLATDPEKYLDVRELESLRMGERERITDMDKPHIRELPTVLPEIFAGAAARAQAAGFDGVELHYAHAYTMASFLSARNTREDGYGGSREHRIRLPLEVYRRVRGEVGPEFKVGCRFLAEECIEGGSPLQDSIYFGVEFARAGMDFLSLSRGGKFEDAKQPNIGWAAYPYTGPSGYECMPTFVSDSYGPFGRNEPAVAQIRAAVRQAGFETPIVLTGGLCSFPQAEEWLRDGQADIVGSARQSLADPDWFLKMRLGRGAEVRRCKFSNYCEGLDQKHKQVTCQCWDRLDLDEPGVALAQDGRRRLVAPGWKP